ncbi:hypothetical protein ACF0H5_004061 [Mactra antiquata]
MSGYFDDLNRLPEQTEVKNDNTYFALQRRRDETEPRKDVRDSQEDSASVASMDSVGKKKSFRRLISRFAEKTSMVGVPYINNAKFWWAKAIWSFMLLVAMAVMTLHLWYLIDQFFKFPIQTKVSLGFSPLQFPQITICNTNIIRNGRFKQYKGAHELKQLVHEMKPENLVPHQYDSNYDPFAKQPGGDGQTPPDDGSGPPDYGSGPHDDGSGPPGDGSVTPDDGSGPPDDGSGPPGDGSVTPDYGSGPPDDGSVTLDYGENIGTTYPSESEGSTKPPYATEENTTPPGGGDWTPPSGGGDVTPPSGGGDRTPPNGEGDVTPQSGEGGAGTTPSGGSGAKPPPSGGGGPPPKRRRRFVENYNGFNLSSYRDKDVANRREYMPDEDHEYYDGEMDSQTEILDLFKELYMDIPKQDRAFLGHNITDMLVSCTFNGRICDASMFKLHQTSEYGNCWSLSSEKFKVLSAGPLTGLTLVIYLEEMEYMKGITNGFGARIQVSEQGTHPFPAEEGSFIPASMETSIGLKLITLARMGLPYGKCNDGEEFQKKHGVKYTRRVCQAVCESTAIKNKCNCFDDKNEEMYDQRDPSFRPCRSATEIECMMKVHSQQLGGGTCVCDNPCSDVNYVKSVSQRQWPSDDYAMILLEDICVENKNSCVFLRQDMDFDSIRNNFLKLNVYYEDLNYESIEEDAEIEIQQFLSDVGGAIGLWIGLSMLSLCEVIQLFIELCDYGIHKTIKDRRRERKKRRKERNKRLTEERKLTGGPWPHTDFGREQNGHNKGFIPGPSMNQPDINIRYGSRY